jgi:hypothetical protein
MVYLLVLDLSHEQAFGFYHHLSPPEKAEVHMRPGKFQAGRLLLVQLCPALSPEPLCAHRAVLRRILPMAPQLVIHWVGKGNLEVVHLQFHDPVYAVEVPRISVQVELSR